MLRENHNNKKSMRVCQLHNSTARHKEMIAVGLRGFILKKYWRSGGVNRWQQLRERRSLFVPRCLSYKNTYLWNSGTRLWLCLGQETADTKRRAACLWGWMAEAVLGYETDVLKWKHSYMVFRKRRWYVGRSIIYVPEQERRQWADWNKSVRVGTCLEVSHMQPQLSAILSVTACQVKLCVRFLRNCSIWSKDQL